MNILKMAECSLEDENPSKLDQDYA